MRVMVVSFVRERARVGSVGKFGGGGLDIFAVGRSLNGLG